jgi:hypothetical protein
MEKADSQFQLPNEEGFKLKVLQSTLDVDFLRNSPRVLDLSCSLKQIPSIVPREGILDRTYTASLSLQAIRTGVSQPSALHIELYLLKMGLEGMDWIHLAQGRV